MCVCVGGGGGGGGTTSISYSAKVCIKRPFRISHCGEYQKRLLPQPHALPATTASSEPPSGPPKSCFSCGALDHFNCPKNLKTKGAKPFTQEKTPAVCENFNSLKRTPCEEPTTLVLRAEFINVQCVTSWLAKH